MEYAKESPTDILIRMTVHNRGPEAAQIHVLPTLWFRNTWSWGDPGAKPTLALDAKTDTVVAQADDLDVYRLYREGDAPWLFTENDTNPRVFGGNDGEG